MIVRVFLTSGAERVILADGATVVMAQVEDRGIVIEYVPGLGKQRVTR